MVILLSNLPSLVLLARGSSAPPAAQRRLTVWTTWQLLALAACSDHFPDDTFQAKSAVVMGGRPPSLWHSPRQKYHCNDEMRARLSCVVSLDQCPYVLSCYKTRLSTVERTSHGSTRRPHVQTGRAEAEETLLAGPAIAK